MPGPSAGTFDPVRAQFLSPQRTSQENGEPDIEEWVPEFKDYIRWNSTASREFNLQQQTTSVTVVVFRVRRNRLSERIQPDWKLTHRGLTYGITGFGPLGVTHDEIEFVAKCIRKP